MPTSVNRPQIGFCRVQLGLALGVLCLGLSAAGPAAPPQALRTVDPNATAIVVVLAPEGNPIAQAVKAALADPDGQELGLAVVRIETAHPSQRATELRTAVPGLPGTGWALLAPSGALLGSGTTPPGVAVLTRTLADAGIKAPIPALREFLQAHPGQLEARSDLLRRLRRSAVLRTTIRLDLSLDPDAQDLAPFRGKHLKELEDLEIWGPYAQELDRAFQDGSWRSLELGMGRGQPVEACSPTMQGIYARNLTKVESVLAVLPGASAYWEIWLRMSAVSGLDHSRALIQGLVIPPPECRLPWPPPGVVAVLVRDAQKQGDWQLVRDLLQPFWETWRERRGEPDWGSLGPLLEAMLRLRADDEAGALVETLGGVRALTARASALAATCKRPDLARRWAALGK